MDPTASDILGNVVRLFSEAKLEVLSPSLFALEKELAVLKIVIDAVEQNPDVYNNIMKKPDIQWIVEHADFVMGHIAADATFSKILQDRIYREDPYMQGSARGSIEMNRRSTKNSVETIRVIASRLSELKNTLYPPAPPPAEDGPRVPMPANVRFAGVERELVAFKCLLQLAASAPA